MNRAFIGLAVVLVSFAFSHSSGTDSSSGHYDTGADWIMDCPYTFMYDTKSNGSDIYSDAKNYDSFEEWSNAHHGISKEQEEEDERKRQAYLSRYKDDESADTDVSLADRFIAGTAVSVIVSVISWAIHKFKHRK